jgi:phage portal protein BeeE
MLSNLLKRDASISMTDWAKMFQPGGHVTYAGNTYQSFKVASTGGYVDGGTYNSNSVVFACTQNRVLLFSEARFQWQQLRGGRPGDLFADPSLAILESPWSGASTGELLAIAELDVAMFGNSYWIRDRGEFIRLNPADVVVRTEGYQNPVSGEVIAEKLLGYGVKTNGKELALYDPSMVCHYKPHPSRESQFLGMSWLSPALPDVDADSAMTEHKRASVKQGGQLGYVVSLDAGLTKEQFDFAVEKYREQHEGPGNAGKTLFISGGQDVKTVGQTFENMAMKATQGAGETRIAACAMVPPVIVGLSEGLSSATYSNYGQARRRLVDGTMRPLWRSFASAMQSLVPPPRGSRLWYDDRDIPFLREDVGDQAEILSRRMLTIESGVRAGYDPDSVVEAVESGDFKRLVHTGLYSVQLQPPSDGSQPIAPPSPQENT